MEWNDCQRAYPPGELLHQLFETQATESPESIAVVAGDDHLTYAELNRLADRLAGHLASLGAQPETVVGICLESGPEWPLAILATLKTGAAWVPLDPTYPEPRLQSLIRDAGVRILLTRKHLATTLDPRLRRFHLDPDGRQATVRVDREGERQSLAATREDNTAYVLYTSGSTGQPKGVAVSHRAVVNRLRWSQEALPMSTSDRVLQQAASSFDFSIWELFASWLAGATVVLVPTDRRRDAGLLVDLVRDAGITVAHFVPSLIAEWLRSLATSEGERLSRLRRLFSGGEALSASLRDQIFARLDAELINQYGPTEAAIDVTFWPCRRRHRQPRVPIGRPIANTRIQVLDGQLQPVPEGELGEIHIAGVALARGYIGRAGSTADNFLPDPESPEPGGRLYRTGDRARFLADGALDFAGRQDRQIKIRGQRLELREIEATLEQHPAIRRAAVLAIRDPSNDDSPATNDPRLMAFVVPEPQLSPASVDLRQGLSPWARQRLPDFMVPTAFASLSAMPLTAASKLDRRRLELRGRQLLRPTHRQQENREPRAMPRTPHEELLAEIWSEVLGVAPIGVHDHFLELGGHSLLAARVADRVRRAFDLELTVEHIFQQPTIATLAQSLDRLTSVDTRSLPDFEPGKRPSVLPLSFAQERLWFLDRLEPLSPAYNLPSAWRLTGDLNIRALQRSLREMVRRHEVLRTRFSSTRGQPRQEILPSSGDSLGLVDLERLPTHHRWSHAQRLAVEEATRPFDLSLGAAHRARLLRLDSTDHVLLLTFHHIVFDAWSQRILRRELAALYRAYSVNPSAKIPTNGALPTLTVQVADHALAQRRWMRDEVLRTRLASWRSRLGDRPPILELATDRPRPQRPSHRGVSQRWSLSATLTSSLRALGATAGASLYMTLLAAFLAFLHRLTQQRQILVGSPIASRSEATADLIGLFVNTLVMRGDFGNSEDRQSFAQHLDQVRSMALEAYAHHELPFEKLVEELQPERDPSRNPLFQATLILDNIPPIEPRLAGLEVQPLEMDPKLLAPQARFDLALYFKERQSGLEATLVGARDLFDRTTIVRFSHTFHRLLQTAAEDPEQTLTSLQVLTRVEQHQLLLEWAGRPEDPSADTPHGRIEAQATRTPDAVALVFQNRRLSYSQLDLRATQLAQRHLTSPPSPDGASTVIAICLERGPEMVIAMLAVLKAGQAYLFIDPAQPSARRSLLLEDAGVRRLLTSRSLAPGFAHWQGQLFCLDELDRQGEGGMTRPWGPAEVSPLHPAYVTYTSGSTGRPKGVVSHHGGATTYLEFIGRRFGLSSVDVTLQLASPAFDRSVRDLLAPLAAGATVVLSEARRDAPDRLLREVENHRVSCLPAMVPSLLRQLGLLADAAPPRQVPGGRRATGPRLLLFAGESFTWADHQLVRLLFGEQARWANLYGPTEATCTSTAFAIQQTPDKRSLETRLRRQGSISIGRAQGQATAYLCDRKLRPVPVGAAGELILAGLGLAQGYWRRRATTAQAFVPSPWASEPGQRLYRTGDRARYRADGRLEHLGRIDHQLKIRGHRVEPGEVEAALTTHPKVRAAGVTGHETPQGDVRLVAHILGTESQARLPGAELRRFLQGKLPDPLIPAVFRSLAELPLTPSGKIDRGRLALEVADKSLTRLHPEVPTPTRGPIEEILAGIWRELLGVQDLGRHDDFFELGGHSLLATRVISRIRRIFDIELPLRRLFEAPTIARFARALEATRRAPSAPQAIPPLEAGLRPPELPLSFAQERFWFLDRFEPGSAAYHMVDNWQLHGPLDTHALEGALRSILHRHQSLRSRFPDIEGEPRQRIAERLELVLPLIDLTRLTGSHRQAQAQKLQAAEAARSFELARGRLLRGLVLRLEAERHHFLLTVHHIVSDGWSQGNLRRELRLFYRSILAAEPSNGLPAEISSPPEALPQLPIQYVDFVLWQRRWLRDEQLEAQLAYWRKQLAGPLPSLQLPTDRSPSTTRGFHAASVPIRLGAAATEALKRSNGEAGATLFMGLLAAFGTLLWRYSGHQELMVGSPIAGRRRSEVEPLIGLFASTLPLRVDLSPDRGEPLGLRKLLERIRRMALEAYMHQDVPFARLAGTLGPRDARGNSPLFNVLLTLHNAPAAPLQLECLRCERLPDINVNAKVDLSLNLKETPDGLTGELIYRAELFDASRIRRMAGHLRTLLEAIEPSDPGRPSILDRPIEQLPLLRGAERHQILSEWNDTQTEPSCHSNLHSLFERQVARSPDRIALIYQGQYLSYRQLDQLAHRLAHELSIRGVGRGDVVPLLAHPGLEVPIALLAVMKSGAAYSPLDVNWPAERITRILEQLDARVVLAGLAVEHAGLRGDRAEKHWRRRLRIARPASSGRTVYPTAPIESTASAADPIYAMFTSGSTGEPKAAVNTHAGIVNRFAWMDRHFGCGQAQAVLQTTRHTFDSSIWQLFWPLLSGGRAVIPTTDASYDPDTLIALLEQQRITLTDFVPSALELLVHRLEENPKLRRQLSLRQLIVGGEAIQAGTIDRFQKLFPKIRVTNLYGPTETAIGVTSEEIRRHTARPIPIGRPIDNVAALVLDRELEPSAIGVTGEIYLGGVCVGLGYLGDPDRSAQVFLNQPHPEVRGHRLYKTGDRACYRPNGAIEFLGRVDHQLKIRGFRIEPGEIENALREHPSVREAAVVVRQVPRLDTGVQDDQLVAYVVAHRAPSGTELRTMLERRLPSYMMPSQCFHLQSLPLTASGKVDRAALALGDPESIRGVPLELRSTEPNSSSEPRNPIEQQLATIWTEVLGRQDFGREDNFFQLGGHSLLAVRLMARIEHSFQLQLPLSTLFDAPTIARLARRIQLGNSRESSPLVLIRSATVKSIDRPPSIFSVHPIGGQVLCYRDLAHSLRPVQAFYGLQAQVHEAGGPLDSDIQSMAARYLEAIQSIQPQGPYRLTGWSMGGVVAYEIACRLQRLGEDVGILALIDTAAPGERSRSEGAPRTSKLQAFAKDLQLPVDLASLTDEQLDDGLRRIHRAIQRAGDSTVTIDREQLHLLYRLFENNLRALRNYTAPSYPGRLLLLKSSQRSPAQDPTLGWGSLAKKGVEVRTLPGNHYSMLREPHVRRLAKKLEQCISRGYRRVPRGTDAEEDRSVKPLRRPLGRATA